MPSGSRPSSYEQVFTVHRSACALLMPSTSSLPMGSEKRVIFSFVLHGYLRWVLPVWGKTAICRMAQDRESNTLGPRNKLR
jgi:hypothetical protein